MKESSTALTEAQKVNQTLRSKTSLLEMKVRETESERETSRSALQTKSAEFTALKRQLADNAEYRQTLQRESEQFQQSLLKEENTSQALQEDLESARQKNQLLTQQLNETESRLKPISEQIKAHEAEISEAAVTHEQLRKQEALAIREKNDAQQKVLGVQSELDNQNAELQKLLTEQKRLTSQLALKTIETQVMSDTQKQLNEDHQQAVIALQARYLVAEALRGGHEQWLEELGSEYHEQSGLIDGLGQKLRDETSDIVAEYTRKHPDLPPLSERLQLTKLRKIESALAEAQSPAPTQAPESEPTSVPTLDASFTLKQQLKTTFSDLESQLSKEEADKRQLREEKFLAEAHLSQMKAENQQLRKDKFHAEAHLSKMNADNLQLQKDKSLMEAHLSKMSAHNLQLGEERYIFARALEQSASENTTLELDLTDKTQKLVSLESQVMSMKGVTSPVERTPDAHWLPQELLKRTQSISALDLFYQMPELEQHIIRYGIKQQLPIKAASAPAPYRDSHWLSDGQLKHSQSTTALDAFNAQPDILQSDILNDISQRFHFLKREKNPVQNSHDRFLTITPDFPYDADSDDDMLPCGVREEPGTSLSFHVPDKRGSDEEGRVLSEPGQKPFQ